ncbi:hypothetical protein [Erwinia sp. 9145]|uniref:hypothetical protein n=1 Tax=Erwinia sp. 9145 TaxID=1500895 RepID=UPI000557EAA5|nr:hypothetical protein [Erwinia sp. 9145]
MKILNHEQIVMVSGGGIIENVCGGVGGIIGGGLYGIVGGVFGGIQIDLPIIGSININDLMPELGKDVGSTIGGSIGGTVEGVIGSIPIIGGILSKILGN